MTNVQEALKEIRAIVLAASATDDDKLMQILHITNDAITESALSDIEKCEPVYQYREIGEGNWVDCKKEWFSYCKKQPEMDTRILYTSPQPIEKCEPVAKVVNKFGDPVAFAERELEISDKVLQKLPIGAELYTSPISKEWVGLTDEDIKGLPQPNYDITTAQYVKLIEAKLKQLNAEKG
jgi:hypothetical protein